MAQPYPNRAPAAASNDYRPDLNVRLACPDCRETGTLIEQFASGDIVCGNCGIVLGDKIVDTRSEWRTFADSEGDDPSRVGGPGDPLLSGAAQLSSVISFKDNHSGTARSLQRAAQAVASKTGEKTLVEAFQEIQDMCDQIALPRVVSDSAKQLFKRQEEEKLLRGKHQKAIIAACIFIACRGERVERSFKEIVALSGVPKKKIAECFNRMAQAFGIAAANTQDSSSAGLVSRICNQFGFPPAVQSAAVEVVRKMDEIGSLAGRSPISIASACVYFTSHAFGMGKPAREVAHAAGTTESTLRQAYAVMYYHRERLLSQKWMSSRGANSVVADLARIPKTEAKVDLKGEPRPETKTEEKA